MVQLNEQEKEHLRLNFPSFDYMDIKGLGYDPDNPKPVILVPDEIPDNKYNILLENMQIISMRIRARKRLFALTDGDLYLFDDEEDPNRITSVSKTDFYHYSTGSFYMLESGYSNFSGTFGNAVNRNSNLVIKEKREAEFWFFSQDRAGANRRINFFCPVNVWEYPF